MISQRIRESKRVKALKMPKNIERVYKQSKCRDCTVAVTRMDFAKILGKFTKVKIQYESSTPKTKKGAEATSPNSNARLKSNENGMVLIHRNAYSQHPVKELLTSKKTKGPATPVPTKQPVTHKQPVTPKRPVTPKQPVTPKHPVPTKQSNNVLKENNRLKKTPIVKDKNSNISISSSTRAKKGKNNNLQLKKYGIVFTVPIEKNKKKEPKNKITLQELLPLIDKSILPNKEWSIDYLPRNEEPKNDKVYDRIAAELEDLMYSEKPGIKADEKLESSETKVDDFPSIMDILNGNSNESNKQNGQNSSTLESSDVEAMLLGKPGADSKGLESTVMEVDNTDMSNLIADVAQLNAIEGAASDQENIIKIPTIEEDIDNPHSPSILDEALQKGIEEHLPSDPSTATEKTAEITQDHNANCHSKISDEGEKPPTTMEVETDIKPEKESETAISISFPPKVSHLIFRKNVDGECLKCVTCPKNLKYNIELDGKSVEFLGAPKLISSLDDLQVLLQIVNETDLNSLYVCQ